MRQTLRALLLLSAGVVLSAASCGEEPVECDGHDDCGGAQSLCNGAGECVACLETADCADGLACTADGACAACGPLPDGPTCGAGYACGGNGRCVALPICEPGCGAGQTCTEEAGGNRCIYTTVVDALAGEGLRNMHAVVTDPHGANMEADLRGAAATTVFTPRDQSLAALSAACVASLDGDPARWALFVGHHVLSDPIALDRATMVDGVAAESVDLPMRSRESVELTDDGGVSVDGHPLAETIEALNGWVHVLDTGVLVPDALHEFDCRP